ncbi:polyprenyl synthetase family protein [Helicobacter sp. 13S00401-1]|uniref:polyprenyl synthetase family protein n=1 Tax=Helicobacter sp. 13S00401-1 TaxID=1905758 RepID=UPI0023B8EE71|nr:polyprenyl synthetase family protein [Helicobacter sp. 13S00401-1]
MQDINNISKHLIHKTNNNFIISMFNLIKSGKMLRSKLILSIATPNEETLKLCSIIELIQSASLLHDDVIDESTLRRNAPSINALFDNKASIMLGDVLYSSAFYELTSLPEAVAKSVSKSVISLSSGEILDVELAKSLNSNLESYLKMIELKSASLIAASSESAALLEGLDHKAHYEYGLNLGIAFQIIDDILDITQDEKTLGKPSMNDFTQGKTTLPYIYFYHESEANAKLLESLFAKKLDSLQKEMLKKSMEKSLLKAKNLALEYANKATNLARKLNNEKLDSIVKAMIERDF